MDIFDKFQYGDSSVDLTAIAQETPKPITVPMASVRNRAATTVLLNPSMEDPIRQYESMVAEGEQGADYTYSALRQDIEKKRDASNIKGVMDILADKTIDIETKKNALAYFRKSPLLNDSGNELFAATLSADVKGENRDAEAARVSGAELFGEIYRARTDMQGLVNAHAASLDNLSFGTAAQMAELSLIPFAMNKQTGQLYSKVKEREGAPLSYWETVKGYLAAGNSKAEIADKLKNLPPEKQAEFLKGLLEDIKASSKVIFSNDSQFAQFMNVIELGQQGNYSGFDKLLDNIAPLLDAVGLGASVGSYKAAKALKTLQKEAKAIEATQVAKAKAEAAVGPPRPLPGEEGFSSPFAAAREAKQAKAQKEIDFDPSLPTESRPEGPIPGIMSERTPGVSFLEGGSGVRTTEETPRPKQVASLFREPPVKAEAPASTPGNQYTISDAISADGPTSETVRLITDGNGNTAIVRDNGDVIDITNMIKAGFSPERAIAQTLGDDTSGKNVLSSSTKNPLQEGVSTLLGGTGKKVVEEEPKKKLAALFQRIEINNVVRAENPASPAKIVQQTNPDKAAALHEMVVRSEGDEVAQALYGTNKVEAIASDILPQVTVGNGAVVTKPGNIQINLRQILDIPRRLLDFMAGSGSTEYSAVEKASAVAHVKNDFTAMEGLQINDSMSSFAIDGGKVKISATYQAGEGAWSSAQEAFDQAKVALRKYAVADNEIVVLRKEGLDHIPVNLSETAGEPGNYLIRVETTHDIDPTDITSWMVLDVKKNWMDRIPQLVSNDGGSATRYLFDAASTLHPLITGPAAVATYRTSALEKYLLNLASEYADKWKALDKQSKVKLDSYIRDANYNGIAFDPVDLLSKGWAQSEIDAIHSWRNFWDTHFYLENYDLVRTLNSQGYELFKGPQTDLVAKSIPKNQNMGASINGNSVIGGTPLYNPATDTVTVLTKQEINDLYTANGSIARLRRPQDFNGVNAEYMIVRNTPTEYLRKMRDTDQILNYRNGYFQIQYNAPKFVDEILERDKHGVPTKWKTLAVAPDSLEAESFRRRTASTSGKSLDDFRIRGDDRGMAKDSDSWWDVNSASGRIAQRTRGKLLEDAVGMNQLGDTHVLSPVDSATRAARSISGRIVTRPVLEAAKSRAVHQYAAVFPSDGFGGRRWPRSVGEIGQTGEYTNEMVRDARTTFEYINYLENGYVNGMDNTFKALLNSLSTQLGKLAVSKDSKLLAGAERSVNVVAGASGGPVSATKNFVFFAYLASNVLRQLIIQPHQIVRTFSYNPKGWLSGNVHKLLGGFLADLGGMKNMPADVKDFVKFVDDSGLLANVDKQNLVRGVLTDAAHSSNRFANAVGTAMAIPRKAGFDIGEQGNMLGHAAAVYDKFVRDGKNMASKSVRDDAIAELSAISYGMNFAEDMPYNQTSAALILQFMQVPHKAFLQATNRRIPVDVRLRMVAADVVLWGGPALIISDMMGGDILPENPRAREFLVWGLESMLLNQMFQTITGEDTDIDFSSFAPYDMTGWAKVMEAIMTGGVEQLILASPAANLLFKDGSKAEIALKTMARFFNDMVDPQDDPTTAAEAAHAAFDMLSGYSNAVKAIALLNYKQRVNAQGVVVERDVDYVEAAAQLLGFGGKDAKELYSLQQEWFKDSKTRREDALKLYKDVKTMYYTKLGKPDTDVEMVTRISSHFMGIIKKDPEMAAVVVEQMRKDFQGKDKMLLFQMLQSVGIVTRDQLKRMPGLTDEERQMANKIIDEYGNARKELIEAQK